MATESRFTMTRRSILDYFLGGGFLALLGTMFYPVFRFILPSRFAVAHVDSVRGAAKAEIKPNTPKRNIFAVLGLISALEATRTLSTCAAAKREGRMKRKTG